MRISSYPYFFKKILFKISKISGQSETRFAIKCWSTLYRTFHLSVPNVPAVPNVPTLQAVPSEGAGGTECNRVYWLYRVGGCTECTERPGCAGCTKCAEFSENGGCKKAFL